MIDMIQVIPFSFAALFPVVNPIGSSVIFASIVNGCSKQEYRTLALKIAIYSACLLTVSLFAGSWILRAFGVTIPIVLIGGGLVIAYIGWQLLNQPSSAVTTDTANVAELSDGKANAMAFYPLTMPITAGPGCVAVAIALGAHSLSQTWEQTLANHLGNTIGIILICLCVYFCFRYTQTITQKLGTVGTAVIMRLAAFFNLCIGLQLIAHGIRVFIQHV